MPDDFIVRHPSERGRSAHRSVVVYACCTCCCCCLHTVGALAGALVGGGFQRPESDPGFDPERRIPFVHWLFDRWPRTQWVYWTSFFWVMIVAVPFIALYCREQPLQFPIAALVVYVLGGPGFVLGAWLLSLIRLALKPASAVAPDEFWAIHRMLLGGVLGTLAGCGLMYFAFLLFTMK